MVLKLILNIFTFSDLFKKQKLLQLLFFQVITTTTYSTETVIVNDPSPSPQSLPLNKAAAYQNYVNRLKLVKSLLGLKL